MWNQAENGVTIGSVGSENGEIVEDLEHMQGARLTLEKDGTTAPYAITSGVYGRFFHTTYLSTMKESISEISAMKSEISEFFSTETTYDKEQEWIVSFVGRH